MLHVVTDVGGDQRAEQAADGEADHRARARVPASTRDEAQHARRRRPRHTIPRRAEPHVVAEQRLAGGLRSLSSRADDVDVWRDPRPDQPHDAAEQRRERRDNDADDRRASARQSDRSATRSRPRPASRRSPVSSGTGSSVDRPSERPARRRQERPRRTRGDREPNHDVQPVGVPCRSASANASTPSVPGHDRRGCRARSPAGGDGGMMPEEQHDGHAELAGDGRELRARQRADPSSAPTPASASAAVATQRGGQATDARAAGRRPTHRRRR